jgi:hypothetical protein
LHLDLTNLLAERFHFGLEFVAFILSFSGPIRDLVNLSIDLLTPLLVLYKVIP